MPDPEAYLRRHHGVFVHGYSPSQYAVRFTRVMCHPARTGFARCAAYLDGVEVRSTQELDEAHEAERGLRARLQSNGLLPQQTRRRQARQRARFWALDGRGGTYTLCNSTCVHGLSRQHTRLCQQALDSAQTKYEIAQREHTEAPSAERGHDGLLRARARLAQARAQLLQAQAAELAAQHSVGSVWTRSTSSSRYLGYTSTFRRPLRSRSTSMRAILRRRLRRAIRRNEPTMELGFVAGGTTPESVHVPLQGELTHHTPFAFIAYACMRSVSPRI